MREFFWPRKGFIRPLRYLSRRILRLSATPHAIATGVAAGAFSSFTPLLGFHALLALGLAWLLSGNLLAAFLTTALANPLTIPVIAIGTLRTGESLLGVHSAQAVTAGELFDMLEDLEFAELWQPVLKPMLAGSAVLGSSAAVVAYAGTRLALGGMRARRPLPRHGDPSP